MECERRCGRPGEYRTLLLYVPRGLVEFTPISPFLAEEHPKSAPNLTALPDPNGTTAAAELCGTVKVSSKSAHGVARNVFFGCREQAGASAEVATAASPT